MPIRHDIPSRSSQDTSPTLKLLLADVVDYAGLYPPAELPLDDAVRRYARYLNGPDSWMLGRFVGPAGRLGELAAYAALFRREAPCRVALLSAGGLDAESFLETFAKDLRLSTDAARASEGRVLADTAEAKWPGALLHDTAEAPPFLTNLAHTVDRAPTSLSAMYLEFPLGMDQAVFTRLLTALTAFNASEGSRRGIRFGAKMRCGGADPSAFPTAQAVAAFILACTEARVPFKATAGLHHPLPQDDPSLGVRMHGFLNVLLATLLAREAQPDEQELVDVLDDADPGSFTVGPEYVAWQKWQVSKEAVARGRSDGLVSFGSCSFDEPRDGLRELGLLP